MEEFRKKIDDIDIKLCGLLDQRAEIAKKIGKIKEKDQEQVFSPDREKKVLDLVIAHSNENNGAFPVKAKINIFREIMATSRVLQKDLKISFLGPLATFTHLAAIRHFSDLCQYSPASSIQQVFRDVEKSRADYGVVPVENSTEGVVSHTLDMFFDSECKICAELIMEVSHHLLSRDKEMNRIKKIYSHTQAFAQCEMWLEEHMPMVRCIEVSSTAEAAQKASCEKNTAAIAARVAAEVYNLNILAERIEDIRENVTRFFIIGRESAKVTSNPKTTIMFSMNDRVGGLHDMLVPFKRNKLNLTKIESRPSRIKAWTYVFFIDMEGHIDQKEVQDSLSELKGNCLFLKVLGSYPTAMKISDKLYD
ncbi:MAG: prephenate dehydratase [Elusimicrobiota bacterium]